MATKTTSANRKIWDIAESMWRKDRSVRRAHVIATCLKRGIPHGSVLTQVPAWVTARRVFTTLGFIPGIVGDDPKKARVVKHVPRAKAKAKATAKAKEAPQPQAKKDASPK